MDQRVALDGLAKQDVAAGEDPDLDRVQRHLAELKARAVRGEGIVDKLVDCADGGVTIGEMAGTLAEVFGEHVE